jgi:hypothetical protein
MPKCQVLTEKRGSTRRPPKCYGPHLLATPRWSIPSVRPWRYGPIRADAKQHRYSRPRP